MEQAIDRELAREQAARSAAQRAGRTPPESLHVTEANNRCKIFCGYR